MKGPNSKPMPRTKTRRMTIDRLATLIQGEFLSIYERFNLIDEKFCVIERKLNELRFEIMDMKADINKRIIRLEQKVGV